MRGRETSTHTEEVLTKNPQLLSQIAGHRGLKPEGPNPKPCNPAALQPYT